MVETAVAEELGVSRTPVREAIRQLEIEGLVKVVPNRGAVVRGMNRRDISDTYSIRERLEGLAARWAAERASDNELRLIKETMALMKLHAEAGDLDEASEQDTQFHRLLLEGSKSKPLFNALLGTVYFVQRARTVSLSVPGRVEKSLAEHEQIFQALARRDPDAAERAVVQHNANACSNVLSYLDRQGIDVI